ncbi:hypothetical protein HAX54_035506 [Datura stramonium]|uniref:Uncharacterized protein n=1 Tax=Datura stramonium TaxID=4076 RepID=A0ABS8VGU7_DATST|nr:hypothetical protein [Datura stramonium]
MRGIEDFHSGTGRLVHDSEEFYASYGGQGKAREGICPLRTRLSSGECHVRGVERAINKDLAIVHNTIEDLEKRFYEIEGISTRDAIASLKPMIKVKNDVQES